MKIVFRFLGTNIFFNEKVNTKNVNNICIQSLETEKRLKINLIRNGFF